VDDNGLEPVEVGSDSKELETDVQVPGSEDEVRRWNGAIKLTIRVRRVLPFLLDLLNDPVQQIVEKLVSVLMHRTPEEFIELFEFLDERSGGDGALVAWVFRNVYKQRPEGGRERSWRGGYKGSG